MRMYALNLTGTLAPAVRVFANGPVKSYQRL